MMCKKGFTLIEFVLVIAILGILSVAAIIYVVNYRRAYLEVASQKARADIEHARGLAMTKKGTTFGVFFDQSENRYTVYEGNIGAPVKDPQTKQNLIEDFAKFPGVSITGGDYRVEFNALGAPTTGGGSDVQFVREGETRTLTVLPTTGKVVMEYAAGGCGCILL